jgi:adenine/guanine phosphoribosyltransferase-like PRPP-binding protein
LKGTRRAKERKLLTAAAAARKREKFLAARKARNVCVSEYGNEAAVEGKINMTRRMKLSAVKALLNNLLIGRLEMTTVREEK